MYSQQMDQCKRIFKLPGEYFLWSHLGISRTASVSNAAAAPPASYPKSNTRWRRYNPMSKLRWRKNKPDAAVVPRVHGHKLKSSGRPGAKLNLVNPLYYIRRIKNHLSNNKRPRTPAAQHHVFIALNHKS